MWNSEKVWNMSFLTSMICLFLPYLQQIILAITKTWKNCEHFLGPLWGDQTSNCFVILSGFSPMKKHMVSAEAYLVYDDTLKWKGYPANIYLFKFSNRNIRKRCEMCSKLTLKTPEQHQWHRSGFFMFNVEHISHL